MFMATIASSLRKLPSLVRYGFSAGALYLISHGAFAQEPHPLANFVGEELETRVSLNNLDPGTLDVDEAVFLWVLKEGTFNTFNGEDKDFVVGVEDLEYLAMKVDYTDPENGDLFVDVIIEIDPDSLEPEVQGEGPSEFRSLEEVKWVFEFFDPRDDDPDDENDAYDQMVATYGVGKVLDFRNIVNVVDVVPPVEPEAGAALEEAAVLETDGEIFFKVELCCEYEIVSYSTGGSWSRTWEEAQSAASDMGGYLATLTSQFENEFVNDIVQASFESKEAGSLALPQVWIGGYYAPYYQGPIDGCTTVTDPDCWQWVNGEGLINYDNYQGTGSYPWFEGEPNNPSSEFWLATNLKQSLEWNNSTTPNDCCTGGFVVETPENVRVTLFIDGQIVQEALQDEIIQWTYLVSGFFGRNIPINFNTRTVYENLGGVKEYFNVLVEGDFNLDVCIAPDPRDVYIYNGDGRPPKGQGNTDSGGYSQVYNPQTLYISELAGTGTCFGDLEYPDEDYADWESLLADVTTSVGKEYRGFRGKFDLNGNGTSENELNEEQVWIVVVVERTTAEIAGPASSAIFWELLGIDYTDAPADPTVFNPPLAFRALDLGATNTQFGEWPNVEGDEAIPVTTQFNRSWSLTRRTTVTGPFRLATEDLSDRSAIRTEERFLDARIQGILDTLTESSAICTFGVAGARDDEFAAFQSYFEDAENAISDEDYPLAISLLEDLAYLAYGEFDDLELTHPDPADFPDFDISSTSLGLFESRVPGSASDSVGCEIPANVSGNLTARLLNLAFLLYDRYENATTTSGYVPYANNPGDAYGLILKFKPHLRD